MRFDLSLAAVVLSGAATLAAAQDYPAKPIRIIDAFVPGGITELLARLIGQKMSDDWGHPVIVEPKPGGGGNSHSGQYQHHYVSAPMRSGHGWRWRCANALRRDVVRPGQDQCYWKAHQ